MNKKRTTAPKEQECTGRKGRTRLTYGHVPVVLSKPRPKAGATLGLSQDVLRELAEAAVETKLTERGFVTNAEEAIEEADPIPDRIEDLPEGGYFVELATGEKWASEYKRWTRHFTRTDPKNMPFLGVMFDSIINVLVIYDCRNHTGGIRVT